MSLWTVIAVYQARDFQIVFATSPGLRSVMVRLAGATVGIPSESEVHGLARVGVPTKMTNTLIIRPTQNGDTCNVNLKVLRCACNGPCIPPQSSEVIFRGWPRRLRSLSLSGRILYSLQVHILAELEN